MLTKQRHEEMINIIRERGSITTNEMAKILGISESTALFVTYHKNHGQGGEVWRKQSS